MQTADLENINSFFALPLCLAFAHTKHTPIPVTAFSAKARPSQPTMASDNTISKLIARITEPESDNVHSFYGSWPREIRDQIYDLIFQEKVHPISVRTSGIEAYNSETRTILPFVRLTSRQFKLEYDERDEYNRSKNQFRVCQVDLTSGPYFFGFKLVVPKLAVRTTVLHLDLKCCQDTHDPAKCLIPADGSTQGIGGSKWFTYNRRFVYDIADLPLLEKACIHVSCIAMKRAIDLLPLGDPLAKIPMLAQISTFSNSYVQGRSHDVGVPPGKPEDSGGFVTRRQTKAIWTHVNGWDNEAKLNTIRGREMQPVDRGMGIVFF
jgi:hypothetical protein